MENEQKNLLCSSYISQLMEFVANIIEQDAKYNLQNKGINIMKNSKVFQILFK